MMTKPVLDSKVHYVALVRRQKNNNEGFNKHTRRFNNMVVKVKLKMQR